MAQVKLSGLISDIKGSIGGTTFQRSGSGLTMRKKPLPLKAKTNAQTQVRILQSRLNFEWLELTDQQRDTWQSFADFTNGYGLSNRQNQSANTGKMQFLSVNFWILLYGKNLLTVPTFQQPLDPVIPCPPYYNYSDNLMNYDGTLDTSTQILVTRVSLPQSLATRTANTGFRTLVYSQVNGSQQNWATAYLNTYGVALVYGKKYWIELQVVDFTTGSISAPARKLVEYRNIESPLILTIDTTKSGSASDTFVLRCGNTGTYDARIEWGDGSESSIASYNDANLSHTYSVPGVYSVSIYGTLPWINFNGVGDCLKVTDITQWGDWEPDSMYAAFRGATNLVGSYADTLQASSTMSMQQAFDACTSFIGSLSNLPLSSNVLLTQFLRNIGSYPNAVLGMNITSLSNMNQAFSNSGMSTANYTATIVDFANFVYDNGGSPSTVSATGQTGMTFDTSLDGGDNFADAGAARTYLTSTLSWNITGDTVI